MAQPVTSGDVYVFGFHEEVLCGCVDKMAVQIGPFPGVSRSLAYIPEALSVTPRFWRMSSPARQGYLPGRGILGWGVPALLSALIRRSSLRSIMKYSFMKYSS